jgi:hypothetical protein
MILTPTTEILPDEPLAVIAITTTFPEPPTWKYVELPWNPDPRRTSTGLARRSAVVIGWLDTVYADEIDGIIGTVPPRTFAEVQTRLSTLERDER